MQHSCPADCTVVHVVRDSGRPTSLIRLRRFGARIDSSVRLQERDFGRFRSAVLALEGVPLTPRGFSGPNWSLGLGLFKGRRQRFGFLEVRVVQASVGVLIHRHFVLDAHVAVEHQSVVPNARAANDAEVNLLAHSDGFSPLVLLGRHLAGVRPPVAHGEVRLLRLFAAILAPEGVPIRRPGVAPRRLRRRRDEQVLLAVRPRGEAVLLLQVNLNGDGVVQDLGAASADPALVDEIGDAPDRRLLLLEGVVERELAVGEVPPAPGGGRRGLLAHAALEHVPVNPLPLLLLSGRRRQRQRVVRLQVVRGEEVAGGVGHGQIAERAIGGRRLLLLSRNALDRLYDGQVAAASHSGLVKIRAEVLVAGLQLWQLSRRLVILPEGCDPCPIRAFVLSWVGCLQRPLG